MSLSGEFIVVSLFLGVDESPGAHRQPGKRKREEERGCSRDESYPPETLAGRRFFFCWGHAGPPSGGVHLNLAETRGD